jgi:H+/Cl- antiporter ClcA
VSEQEPDNSKSVRKRIAALLARFTPTEHQRLLSLTILSGSLCGLAAVAFHTGISKAETLLIDRALVAPHPGWIYWTILMPAVGGLVVGLGLRYWAPGAVGSGIPQVKFAYALHAGYVPIRDAIAKFVLGIIQIGTGSSLGREGPTFRYARESPAFWHVWHRCPGESAEDGVGWRCRRNRSGFQMRRLRP